MEDRVGFIGLGVMGAPMARNVRKTFQQVCVYDCDKIRLSEFSSGLCLRLRQDPSLRVLLRRVSDSG
ncbi:MAG: hypothetical protein KatS3mg024_0188 [Armatimonadota bacterium]|nr:MAG: hypothetical protein KatS3mg024_0188 [Armatimonadota bacterium]